MSRLTPFQKNRAPRGFFETALRAVLINELIRINWGPNILRSCFLDFKQRTALISSVSIVSLPLSRWGEGTLLPLSPCPSDSESGRGAVAAETAVMCLKGAAGPSSSWRSLWVGTGTVAGWVASSPVPEEGVVVGRGNVQRSAGVVHHTCEQGQEVYHLNEFRGRHQRAGKWLWRVLPTTWWWWQRRVSTTQSLSTQGLPCQDLWCLDVHARACHWPCSRIQRHCNQDN